MGKRKARTSTKGRKRAKLTTVSNDLAAAAK
jgi:hypothetical protein